MCFHPRLLWNNWWPISSGWCHETIAEEEGEKTIWTTWQKYGISVCLTFLFTSDVAFYQSKQLSHLWRQFLLASFSVAGQKNFFFLINSTVDQTFLNHVPFALSCLIFSAEQNCCCCCCCCCSYFFVTSFSTFTRSQLVFNLHVLHCHIVLIKKAAVSIHTFVCCSVSRCFFYYRQLWLHCC